MKHTVTRLILFIETELLLMLNIIRSRQGWVYDLSLYLFYCQLCCPRCSRDREGL